MGKLSKTRSSVTYEIDNERQLVTLGRGQLGDAPGLHGTLSMYNANGAVTARLQGKYGNLILGGEGEDGDLQLKTSSDEFSVHLDGNRGRMQAGGGGTAGDVVLKNPGGDTVCRMDAATGDLTLGGNGVHGDITLRDRLNQTTMRIRGGVGDIEFLNADFAEEFDILPEVEAEPGMVMSLTSTGELDLCRSPYDSRVVGVIAGAGDYRPAMILDKQDGGNRMPIAMVGKAFCRTSQESGPIAIGDLMTSSSTPGTAMCANMRDRAFGSVIGKALAASNEENDLIPVLVNLQ